MSFIRHVVASIRSINYSNTVVAFAERSLRTGPLLPRVHWRLLFRGFARCVAAASCLDVRALFFLT